MPCAEVKARSAELKAKKTQIAPSFLIKLALDEGFEFGDGGVGVHTFDVQGDFAAGAGGEHHQAHDALAVDFFAVLFHEYVAAEARGNFNKHGRRPGVDARLVGDGEFLGEKLGVSFFGAHYFDSYEK